MKSKLKQIAFFLYLLMLPVSTYATNYYISSSNGMDKNTGKSSAKAWKTISKVNATTFRPGDSIFFERNGRYEGELNIKQSGTPKSKLVFTAYGNGSKPLFTGATCIRQFISRANIASTPVQSKVYQLYCNDTLKTLARTPNTGFYHMKDGVDNSGFISNGELPDSVYTDATIRMRTIDWVFENRVIKGSVNKRVTIDKSSRYTLSQGYGYYLENKPSFLDMPGEWLYNKGTLKLIASDNTKLTAVEATIYGNGIVVNKGVKYVEISALQFEKYANNGIHIQNDAQHISVINNTFRHIEMIAVFADTCASNIDISHNTMEDVRGRGFFGIRIVNCKITHNKILRTGMIPGLGISGVNGMISIVIQNDEANHNTSISNKNYIAYNYIEDNGYAGIRMDGANSICEYNIVKNSSLLLNDAGGIYCFGKIKGRTYNNIIRHNLVKGVKGNNDATPNNPYAANGIYVDNKSTGIIVENNTVLDVVSSGIMINDNAPSNSILNNTIYNCERGISFSEWANKDSLHSCIVSNNIVVATNSKQIPICLLTFLGPQLKPGTFTNNTYLNAHDGFVIEYKTDPEKGLRRNDLYRLANWNKASGLEQGSQSLKVENTRLIYNDSFVDIIVDNSKGFLKSFSNEVLPAKIVLKPCESKIVFDNSIAISR